ncbi:isoaspartyl peptidase/L-asparaginase family protein [Brevibacterium moorei]|uniref:isoaspartyl peptidase/L-asparaginase family protein n=1 Tax=Brevibacterium moorei TaxID=2968457 RepID=UPI00211C64F4|nr:isoaspartyl peptidase/L-asparaginase [Brevibacterium sp. 68QC2CO]MCQ9386893.1 isoaspartyl peptidase/L-asparaginase [Brevibacterium sp. 68QC2CO]
MTETTANPGSNPSPAPTSNPGSAPATNAATSVDPTSQSMDSAAAVHPVETASFGTDSGPLLIIHGGAGARRAPLSPEDAAAAEAGLTSALEAGQAVLAAGGSALDAVQAAVMELENAPHFNAGRGAALTLAGRAELDSAIMAGDGTAGAVTAVKSAKNPVTAARAVKERTPHVLITAPSEELLGEWGVETAPAEYFITEKRRTQLADFLAKRSAGQTHGTVGAVARDAAGHVAAATSTGGISGQMDGRIGDTPILGAGTYADDASVAVSCTGKGESFMRTVAAHSIATLVSLAGRPVAEAAAIALDGVAAADGDGGVIVVPATGAGVIAYNSGDMYYGAATADGLTVHL